MIRLDNTTRSLVITLNTAAITNQPSTITSYSDNNGTTYLGGTTTAYASSTTQSIICYPPGSSTNRDIDAITICNIDTIQHTINIYLNDSSTLYKLISAILSPNESLIFTHSQGWKTLDTSGNVKSSIATTLANNLSGTPQLPNGVTAITQSPGDNSNKLSTTNYVDAALSAYTNSHSTANSVTVDFGAQPVRGGHFTITGVGFSVGVPVMIMQASTRPRSTLYDNMEMDQIMVSAIAINSTTLQCNWGSSTKVSNQYTFNYWL